MLLKDLDWFGITAHDMPKKAFVQLPPGGRGYLTLWKREGGTYYRFKHRDNGTTLFDRVLDPLEAQCLLIAYLSDDPPYRRR